MTLTQTQKRREAGINEQGEKKPESPMSFMFGYPKALA